MAAFFGAVIGTKQPTIVVPRPQSEGEVTESLHISQVCIPATTSLPTDTRVSLLVKTAEMDPICVATLRVGHSDAVNISVLLDEYAELSVVGPKKAELHVSGYYSVQRDSSDDDEDDDGEKMDLAARVENLENFLVEQLGGGDSDEEDDDEDDSDDEDGDGMIENSVPGETRSKHTHIKELKQDDDDDDSEGGPGDDDGEGEDGEEEDDEDDDEEGDDEDDDEEDDDQAEQEAVEAMMKALAEQRANEAAQNKRKAPEPANGKDAAKKAKVDKKEFGNGFAIEQVKEGPPGGKQAKPGKRVVVKYCGKLQSNGKVFDETKGNKTFSFRLGVGEVIKGWDKGVAGMRVGDKRKLTVPSSMAYGATGIKGTIPPSATLCFDVELVDVR